MTSMSLPIFFPSLSRRGGGAAADTGMRFFYLKIKPLSIKCHYLCAFLIKSSSYQHFFGFA